jgi:uncharacterized protein (UPF0332 family)
VNANDLMMKAVQAASSAADLLENGDTDGACNRAYYAMFDSARAALIQAGHQIGKTHKGVLALFSEQFVKPGLVSKEVGKSLKKAETFRYVADYDSASVNYSDAQDLVILAQYFVNLVRSELMPQAPSGNTPPKG